MANFLFRSTVFSPRQSSLLDPTAFRRHIKKYDLTILVLRKALAMNADQIALLQDLTTFGGLSKEALNILAGDPKTRKFAQGDFLFREGEVSREILVIITGSARVLRCHRGKHYQLTELHMGDCVGEICLIDPGPRSASVQASLPCVAMVLSSKDFNRLRQADLKQFTLLQLNIAREVCRRMRFLEQRLLDVLEGDVRPESMLYGTNEQSA